MARQDSRHEGVNGFVAKGGERAIGNGQWHRTTIGIEQCKVHILGGRQVDGNLTSFRSIELIEINVLKDISGTRFQGETHIWRQSSVIANKSCTSENCRAEHHSGFNGSCQRIVRIRNAASIVACQECEFARNEAVKCRLDGDLRHQRDFVRCQGCIVGDQDSPGGDTVAVVVAADSVPVVIVKFEHDSVWPGQQVVVDGDRVSI